MRDVKEEIRRWYSIFWQVVRRYPWADGLREAALRESLSDWTKLLTCAVVDACSQAGYRAAARGVLNQVLPIVRQEYLGIDVLVFPSTSSVKWIQPVAAIELENSNDLVNIAYALWKVCMVRVRWGALFCYRNTPGDIGPLLNSLVEELMRELAPKPEVLVVIGTRGHAEDFPDGFFKAYIWDEDYKRFRLL